MRTTLTLDQDIAVVIERMRRDGKQSLKEIVNHALREGLKHLEAKSSKQAEPFRTETVSLGKCRIDLIDVDEALAIAEGYDYK